MSTAVVITGHGDFPLGFKSALELLVGDVTDINFVCFNTEFEEYKAYLTTLLLSLSQKNNQVIVFTDLVGGSPFNISSLVCKDVPHVTVIGGSNLPMIIDTITNIKYDLCQVTGDSIIATGTESITAFCGIIKPTQLSDTFNGI